MLSAALMCLSLNVYFEARGEPLIGQHAVAQVTMNRAGRDPSKVCEVVTKPRQFSWTNDKLEHRKGVVTFKKSATPTDKKAWTEARAIARLALNGHVKDFTKGATFFHAAAVKPFWSGKYELVARIGQHKFYRIT